MLKRCLMLIMAGALAAGCQATASKPENSANPRIDGNRIEPYYDEDNSDLYRVNIAMTPDQKLLDVKKIILHKDDSQE